MSIPKLQFGVAHLLETTVPPLSFAAPATQADPREGEIDGTIPPRVNSKFHIEAMDKSIDYSALLRQIDKSLNIKTQDVKKRAGEW